MQYKNPAFLIKLTGISSLHTRHISLYYIIERKKEFLLPLFAIDHVTYTSSIYIFQIGSDTMKIEKISDTQIKFILSQADLESRDIKLEELSSPSDKTQNLFHDIMEQAMQEYNFSAENSPLMVEAVPVASDGIMIIVTKIQESEHTENKLNLLSQNKDIHRFKRKSISIVEPEREEEDSISVYAFRTLDDVIDVCSRIFDSFHGSNSLYKYQNEYYLVLQLDSSINQTTIEDLELILDEYGRKHVSTKLSKYYLIEHGEVILKNSAAKTLAKTFA